MRILIPSIIILLLMAMAIALIYARSQKRKVDGLDDHRLWLSRSERRRHARELVERERQQYALQLQQDLMDLINNKESK